MLSKFFACWLIALVISPFTAPFSTCDLTGLVGTAHGEHTPAAPSSSSVLTTDAAIPGALFLSSLGRVRPSSLSKIALSSFAIPASSSTFPLRVAIERPLQVHVTQTAILRV